MALQQHSTTAAVGYDNHLFELMSRICHEYVSLLHYLAPNRLGEKSGGKGGGGE